MFRCLLNNATRFGWLSLTAIAFLSNGGHAEENDAAPKSLIPIDQVEGPLPDDFVVAEIDGTTIRLNDFLELADYSRQLNAVQTKISPAKYRDVQEKLLRRDLQVQLEQRVLVFQFLDSLTAEESSLLSGQFNEVWQEQVNKMIQRINLESSENLSNIEELERYLREHGETPLEVLRTQFESRLMASEVLRRNITVKDKVKREQATKAFIEYVYANADVRTCLDGTTD